MIDRNNRLFAYFMTLTDHTFKTYHHLDGLLESVKKDTTTTSFSNLTINNEIASIFWWQ
jgi:hypothetical protein